MDIPTPATVLVIEDYDSVRIAIARFLKAGGFTVLDAADADGARAIWAQHGESISLLVVDLALQTTSGPELVREFLSPIPSVPVIFVTATDDEMARRATSSFQDPVILHKPFTAEALVKTVRETLSPEALSGFTTHFRRPAKKN